MKGFEVVKVKPAPSESSRVLILETSSEGEEETVATFSTLEGSRQLAIEPRNKKIPLELMRKAFEKL
jgi:hypothetical protein